MKRGRPTPSFQNVPQHGVRQVSANTVGDSSFLGRGVLPEGAPLPIAGREQALVIARLTTGPAVREQGHFSCLKVLCPLKHNRNSMSMLLHEAPETGDRGPSPSQSLSFIRQHHPAWSPDVG